MILRLFGCSDVYVNGFSDGVAFALLVCGFFRALLAWHGMFRDFRFGVLAALRDMEDALSGRCMDDARFFRVSTRMLRDFAFPIELLPREWQRVFSRFRRDRIPASIGIRRQAEKDVQCLREAMKYGKFPVIRSALLHPGAFFSVAAFGCRRGTVR